MASRAVALGAFFVQRKGVGKETDAEKVIARFYST